MGRGKVAKMNNVKGFLSIVELYRNVLSLLPRARLPFVGPRTLSRLSLSSCVHSLSGYYSTVIYTRPA